MMDEVFPPCRVHGYIAYNLTYSVVCTFGFMHTYMHAHVTHAYIHVCTQIKTNTNPVSIRPSKHMLTSLFMHTRTLPDTHIYNIQLYNHALSCLLTPIFVLPKLRTLCIFGLGVPFEPDVPWKLELCLCFFRAGTARFTATTVPLYSALSTSPKVPVPNTCIVCEGICSYPRLNTYAVTTVGKCMFVYIRMRIRA
jgi:hypothetical protein